MCALGGISLHIRVYLRKKTLSSYYKSNRAENAITFQDSAVNGSVDEVFQNTGIVNLSKLMTQCRPGHLMNIVIKSCDKSNGITVPDDG